MDGTPEPIARLEFDTAALLREHPPVWRHPNKRLIYAIACPPGVLHAGRLGVTRWAALPLPARVPPMPSDLVVPRPGFYDYAALPGLDAVEWHVNFADPHLFVAYGGALFAQDELQVAEHPALGALREALMSQGVEATTLGPAGPTPILVTGVERRASIATDPDPGAGRPHGLYGNAFAAASPEAVRRAATRIEPPTVSNILAMSAPPGGDGAYCAEDFSSILTTACTGFRAAVLESNRLRHGAPVVVHTGYWGCGAFGGNRVLMALLQVVAAGLAGLDRLVFHTGGPEGTRPLGDALALLDRLVGDTPRELTELVDALEARKFMWGVSDGN